MMEYKKIYEGNHVREFVDAFEKSDTKKYIMGRNDFASCIMETIDVDGVIDDFTEDKFWNEKRIYRCNEVEKDALVLVSASVRILSAVKNLIKNGINNFLDCYAFEKNCSRKYKRALFLTHNDGFDLEIQERKNYFEFVSSLFEDELSRNIFWKLVNFRKTYDIGYLCGFTNDPKGQYFDFDLSHIDVFLDVGGYCGETTIEFIKKCPSYKKVYFFEPNGSNIEHARKNLAAFENIIYVNKGCSDKKGKAFITDNLSSSTITESANTGNAIELVTLDETVQCDGNLFVKMDIEGAEFEAILGARNLIKSGKATLAISVYHNAMDFWRIPFLVFSLNKNYKLYMRHYTEGIDETVMFFVPK